MSMDKSWEDQWAGFTSLAKPMHAMHHFTPRAYYSPSASESSSSVSTQASPSFSAQSGASPFARTYTPHSPDVSHRRVCRIGLFYNPPIIEHVKSPSMENFSREEAEKQQEDLVLQDRGLLEDIQHASDLNTSGIVRNNKESFVEAKEAQLVQPSTGPSDEGWLSDSTESWASASSRELSDTNYSSNEADDVLSSNLYEPPQIDPINFCHDVERGSRVEERAGHAAAYHSGISNQYEDENTHTSEMQSYAEFNDENVNISEMQSYVELNDEITSCDNVGRIYESVPSQSRFDNQTSGPTSELSGLLDVRPLSKPHALGLETKYIDRYNGLHSQGHAINFNQSMLYNRRGEGDASRRINADCLAEDYQESPVQAAGEGHKLMACDLNTVENIALQSHDDEHSLNGSCSADSRSSTYSESVSHSKQRQLKSQHSAAVENKYPSSSLHGHFRLVEQDGSQCYSFSVHDSDDMFFARATCQPENEEVPDFMYTFHCRREEGKRKGGRKTLLKREKLTSSLVGKMKVFNAMRTPTDNGCIEETRFVLYGDKSQLPPEKETCSNNFIIKQGSPRVQVELAALVITTTVQEYKIARNKIWGSYLKDSAGWGAAFLEKSSEGHSGAGCSSPVGSNVEAAAAAKENQAASHIERHPERSNWAEKILNTKMSRSKREQPKIAVDVVVILPAGLHGLPRHQDPADDRGPSGPTSLLDCWQCGGHCHCGGWDAGCGLSVLKATTFKMHKPREIIALTNRERINWITPQKPLEIFTQGWKPNRLLMLEMVQTGLFSLSFQARFSPLQAFATVVAIFHEQITHE